MSRERTNITIECLAAQEGKALITLEPGELYPSLYGRDLDEEFPVYLRLAQRWNAIMLITDFDCYARRSEDPPTRSSGRSLLSPIQL